MTEPEKASPIANYFPPFFPKISLLDIIQIGTEQSKLCPIIIQLNTASIIISYN